MLRTLARTYRDAYSGLPRVAWLLALVRFIDAVGFMVLFFLALYCTRVLRFTPAQAGRVVGAFGGGMLIGGYLGGRLSDRLGPFRVQVGALVAAAVTLIASAHVRTVLPLTGLMFVWGAMSAALHPANGAALAQHSPPDALTRGFALNRLGANLGVTFGPAIGGVLALYDYRWIFYCDAGTSLAAALVLAAAAPRRAPATRAPAGEQPPDRTPWTDRPFLAFVALIFLMTIGFNQVFASYGIYLGEVYRLTEPQIGLLLSVNTVLIVLIEMPLTQSMRRFSLARVAAIGALLNCGGFALMPFGRTWLFVAATVVVWTVGEMLYSPALPAIVARRASERQQGSYQGLLAVGFGLGFVVGPPVGTAVYQAHGELLWYLLGVLGVVTGLGFSLVGRRLEAAPADQAVRPIARSG